MKSKCSSILKASIALILTLLVAFGSISTIIAAVAPADLTDSALPAAAKKGFDIADTGANVDLAGTGAVLVDFAVPTYVTCHMNLSGYTTSGTSLSAYGDPSFSKDNGDSNHWIYNFYTAASQSNKGFNWKINAGGDKWFGMGGHSFSAAQESSYNNYLYQNGADDKVSTIAADSGWVHMYIDLYRSYGSNSYMSYVKFYQVVVSQLTSSVSAGKTTLTAGGTTTITASSSGGTGTPTNSIKVYQGSASGTDVTSSVLSGTTFTAPNVSTTTKYYIKNTATDPTIKSYSVTSSATEITVNPASTPTINSFTIDGGTSKTMAVNGTATLASTKSNSSNNVTYAVTAQTRSDGSSGNVVSISGTTVTAIQPGTATITASLTGATSKTVSVTVNKPTISPTSALSLYVYNTAGVSGAVTATPAGTSTTYTSADTSKFTVNTSGKITPVAAGTANLNIAVRYNATYTANFTRSVTVKPRENLYVLGNFVGGSWSTGDSVKMTWDDTDQCYYWTSPNQTASTTYIFGISVDSQYWTNHDAPTISTSGGSATMKDAGSGTNAQLTTGIAGPYKFKATLNASGQPVVTVYYPHTVTFNRNGHGTAPSTQTIVYDGKATKPSTLTAEGWTHDGNWYTDSACTSVFDFNTAIKENKTLYAKWTKNSHTVNYPTTTTGYTLAGTKPTSAEYGDTVSFTVTPDSGYRIDSVKYTNASGTAVDASAGSDNEYHFTMPDADTTVSVTAVKTYTVTLTASATGFASKTYKIGDSGTATTYSSAFIVDSGSKVIFNVTYTSGYEFANVSGATASNSNKTFTINSVTGNTTVTLNAQKISWSGLTAVGKYSTTGASNSYTNSFASNPATIGATTATQLDGTTVTAPATVTVGTVKYNFVDFIVTGSKGTLSAVTTSGTNKQATFKPTAANAEVVARYKKVYTITTNVVSGGEGTGTVTVNSKTSQEYNAGDSYTITVAPEAHSTVDYLRNSPTGTNLTLSSNKYSTTATADVTYYARFTTGVKFVGKLPGSGNDPEDNWTTGVTATWNSDGHYEHTFALNYNKTYTFKSLIGGNYYSPLSVESGLTVTDDNNLATITTPSDNNGVYLQIVPKTSAGVNVKLKIGTAGDGENKIYAVEVLPAGDPISISVGSVTDAAITVTYNGAAYTSGSVSVYPGTKINVSATTSNTSKFVSAIKLGNTTIINSDSGEYTVAAADAGKTITCTLGDQATITAVTNKSSRGTVSVDKTKAHEGETVTITVTPLNGSLTALSLSYAGGDTYDCNLTTKDWTKRTASQGAAMPMYLLNKIGDFAATGAAVDYAETGVAVDYPFTMATTANVTVNATFSSYTAESTWVYNGYDTSGNLLSDYTNKAMTEGMISGEKYSYYKVTRTGSDQPFKVKNNGTATGTRYVYLTTKKDYNDWNLTYGESPTAYFFNASGKVGADFPGTEMTYQSGSDNEDKNWRIAIPNGATSVIFVNGRSGGSQKQTVDLDLTSTNGSYYISTFDNTAGKYTCGQWDTPGDYSGLASGTEYSWNDGVYATGTDSSAPYSFGTSGFNDHGENTAKPKGTGYDSGNYYILVLYPNTTYTINGVTKTTGANPDVIWMSELPSDEENITVYAKDGAIVGYGQTYANLADTEIYKGTSHVGVSTAIGDQTYETYKAEKGDTLKIKTTILSAYRTKYYVRGFCVNGEVPKGTLNTTGASNDGVYELTYTIDDEYDGKYIEITPIYYLANTTANPVVTFRVNGFTDDLKEVGAGKPNWGDTLYAYPYYEQLGSYNNAFGNYPGQPLVYYNGQYQIQIPVKSTTWAYDNTSGNTIGASSLADVNNKIVSGVTMSNGYYDTVHKSIMGYGNNDGTRHVQTYDYDDFYKIFNEVDGVDNIVFDFKYKTTNDNRTDANGNNGTTPVNSFTTSTLTSTFTNGFEELKNYHGRIVDLFGTPLSGAQLSATPVYVVSTAGPSNDHTTTVSNIAGYYATEWAVYGSSNGTNYTRIKDDNGRASIPPSVLIISKADDINDSTYPSASSDKISNYKALYQKLEAYRGKPVMITYEKAKGQKGANNASADISGGATRNDGRWLYSKNGENITSNIKIQVSSDNGVNYDDNPAEGASGHVTGLSAYFTNTAAYGAQTYSTTIDPDEEFDFEAKTTNGSYKFMGWYFDTGVKITGDNVGSTERSGSYTLIAKFMEVTSGQLILSHSVNTGTVGGTTYNGSGTAKIAVTVTDPDNNNSVLKSFESTTSDITLDGKYIGSDKNYNVTVTLTSTATGHDLLGTTILATPSGQEANFFSGLSNYTTSTNAETKTRTDTFTFNVRDNLYNGISQRSTSLIYNSYFGQSVFNYKFKFEAKTRDGSTKLYYREGTLTSAEANEYVVVGEEDPQTHMHPRYLKKSFVEQLAPYESNFSVDYTWNIADQYQFTGPDNYVYNISSTAVTCTPVNSNTRTATFNLPYAHNTTTGVATETDGKVIEATATVFKVENVEFGTIPSVADAHITAPRILYASSSDETGKYFQYWSVNKTKTSGEYTTADEVARCYFNEFNFVAYDNYFITPVYGASVIDLTNTGAFTGVTYLETSRNQWNTDGEYHAKTDRSNAADLLYNDFVLNYNYNNLDIYLNEDEGVVSDLGYVVERVQQLDLKQDGTLNTDISLYNTKGLDEDGVKSVVSGYTTQGATQNGITKYTGSDSRIAKYSVAKDALDNKNRLEIYDAYYNSAGWSKENQAPVAKYTYKNYVYKVYTYMIVDGTTYVSANPAYFTMYDEATK